MANKFLAAAAQFGSVPTHSPAFDENLTRYKQQIPALFCFNALLIATNGTDSRVGSLTADWEVLAHGHLLRRASRTSTQCVEHRRVSLEVMIRGTCDKLRLLDEAWAVGAAGPARRIVALTADGGVGKTRLVNRWLDDMKREQYRGADRVFGWPFYAQGMAGGHAASSDAFIEAALRFFGRNPLVSTQSGLVTFGIKKTCSRKTTF